MLAEAPMKRHALSKAARHRQKRNHDGDKPPLQPAWRADANQLPDEESEIEAARVNQQALQNVRVPAEIDTTHPSRLIQMREGPLQAFAAKSQQSQAARATNAPPIAIHRGARRGLLLPVAPPAIGFRDVGS